MTDTLIKVLELLIAFFADVFHSPFLKGSGIESLSHEEFSNFLHILAYDQFYSR